MEAFVEKIHKVSILEKKGKLGEKSSLMLKCTVTLKGFAPSKSCGVFFVETIHAECSVIFVHVVLFPMWEKKGQPKTILLHILVFCCVPGVFLHACSKREIG